MNTWIGECSDGISDMDPGQSNWGTTSRGSILRRKVQVSKCYGMDIMGYC